MCVYHAQAGVDDIDLVLISIADIEANILNVREYGAKNSLKIRRIPNILLKKFSRKS